MAKDVGWTALQWPSLEHVILSGGAGEPAGAGRSDAGADPAQAGPRAEGRLVLADPGLVSVSYVLTCLPGWEFSSLTVSVTSAAGERALTLTCAGGRWLADGRPRPDLSGCIDIDINRSPLTNTLPIRRLDWSGGQAHELEVAYVSVPELEVTKAAQRYVRLDNTGSGTSAFRYESGSFAADLPVDDSGLVLDYPGLWRRLPAEVAG
jgi:uncharacterized protein